MIIDTINLNLLRVFESVYRCKSMTKAASELFMTQSGVSQNIKSLEDLLDIKLFDRIKQRPVPTDKAKELYQCCLKNLYEIESTLSALTGSEGQLTGDIRVGLPLEFGNNKVIPLIAKFGKNNSEVNFHIKYGHAVEMNQLLVKGDLDFAFIDDYSVDRQIKVEKVVDEMLVLCCSQDYFKNIGPEEKNSSKYYCELDYVDYVEGAPVLKLWFRHHLKSVPTIKFRANLMDVQGIGRIICEGLGAGILPLHVVKRLKSEGNVFHIFKGSGKPFLNRISIAHLEGRSFGQAVQSLKQYLLDNISL